MNNSLGFVGREAILMLDARARAARIETRDGQYKQIFVFVSKKFARKVSELPESRLFKRDLSIMQDVAINHGMMEDLLRSYNGEPQVTVDDCSDDLGYHLEEILQAEGRLVRCWTPRYLIYAVIL